MSARISPIRVVPTPAVTAELLDRVAALENLVRNMNGEITRLKASLSELGVNMNKELDKRPEPRCQMCYRPESVCSCEPADYD
jgi:hypothetical protein